ncbi:MAG: hypothetical protein LC808_34490 [Actinobacteria bacterium]|nr:hypothetical protein [Actinomycetota bacterium]
MSAQRRQHHPRRGGVEGVNPFSEGGLTGGKLKADPLSSSAQRNAAVNAFALEVTTSLRSTSIH